jgi:hypothetical protein
VCQCAQQLVMHREPTLDAVRFAARFAH